MLIKETVTIQVLYYMPDHRCLINEFFWQTIDIVPELPRTHSFLKYWKDNIDAVIKEVMIAHSHQSNWKKIDFDYRC
jgi:uncharacterized protein Usg